MSALAISSGNQALRDLHRIFGWRKLCHRWWSRSRIPPRILFVLALDFMMIDSKFVETINLEVDFLGLTPLHKT